MVAGSDRPFSSFQPKTRSSPTPTPHDPTQACPPASPSFSHQRPGCKAPACLLAARLLSARLLLPLSVCTCACVSVCVGAPARPPLFLPQEQTRPPCPLGARLGPSPLCPCRTSVLVSSCIFLFSPLSLCPSSDLDRDFWNNNESTVQQKWSSYPPKEFILNISPYAPYGDPRLSLK